MRQKEKTLTFSICVREKEMGLLLEAAVLVFLTHSFVKSINDKIIWCLLSRTVFTEIELAISILERWQLLSAGPFRGFKMSVLNS